MATLGHTNLPAPIRFIILANTLILIDIFCQQTAFGQLGQQIASRQQASLPANPLFLNLRNQTMRNFPHPNYRAQYDQNEPTFNGQKQQQQQSPRQQNPPTEDYTSTMTSETITSLPHLAKARQRRAGTDTCSDRLCYGLPMGCLGSSSSPQPSRTSMGSSVLGEQQVSTDPKCNVLVTSKRIIDPYKVTARDIMFELIALPVEGQGNYAAVGFSENGRMQGFVSECIQTRDPKTSLHKIVLQHSYNIPGSYSNVPATIISGIRNLGVSYEHGYFQCRWIVETAVDFSYEALNGTQITLREDLGYKNYHILLASGRFDEVLGSKDVHMDRTSSMAPVSLAQTGHIKSLGAHILIRIHGSLMVAIWVGLVTLSIIMARYYKNEWSGSKVNDVAIWFVAHRTFMLIAWFGSIIAVIFAYMYTESYHPGLHQVSGSICLLLSTLQVLGGLFRPPLESSRRVFFNWAHFICGNLSYLLAMLCLVTAAFLAPAHLPQLYIWIIVAFVGTYVLIHTMMTIHQYIIHRSSSKLSSLNFRKALHSLSHQLFAQTNTLLCSY